MTATADATDRSTVEKLAQTVNELQKTVKKQAERIDQQAEKIERLETEIEIQSSNIGGCHSRVSDLTERIEDLENHRTHPDSTDGTPGVDEEETRAQNRQTPLERICVLPEHIADRELTTNQERARFIARDVHDYAERAPAGLVIDSRTIKKVITAAEGKKPHTQTVARVMEFLADLGQDNVELTKRRGKKLIVINPEAANQLVHHDRCDQGSDSPPAMA